MTHDISSVFPYDQSSEPCPIDKMPDLKMAWLRWVKNDEDGQKEGFPGYVKTLEDHLESSNYHDWVALPNAMRIIVSHTPLPVEEKEKLLKRLCNAVYNFDILDYTY